MAAVLLLNNVDAADNPLRDQISTFEKIRSAEIESRTDFNYPEGQSHSELVRYLVKGDKFFVLRSYILPDGKIQPGKTFAFNGKMWACMDPSSGVLQICPVRYRRDKHIFPWCPGIVTPPPLAIFGFLTFVNHEADERMLFSLDSLQDKDWMEQRLKTSVERIDHGNDGSESLIVLLANQDGPPETGKIEEHPDFELRFVIRPLPEFDGLRLIADIDSGKTGKPSNFHSTVVYKSIVLADGSGSIPFPVEIVEPGHAKQDVHFIVTKVKLNEDIDDVEFDIDPSRAKTILDPFSVNQIAPGEDNRK